ncbi:hypothetical protein [Ectobacillus panaciterrae]|uniref:hypothetical protein n=1 Tax=Ectobacillus panaciterrae TaxID=363872 RepID=UPI0004015F82|nr:hypothetical protein [Ectobacillus panaciterrae]
MTKNHAHIQNSGNSSVSLNADSEVRSNQSQEGDAVSNLIADTTTAASPAMTNNGLLNEQLLASLIPLLNKLVKNDQ